MATCDRCGIGDGGSTDDDAPLGWSLESTERGRRRLCPTCTREHARDIEAKLDEEWWS